MAFDYENCRSLSFDQMVALLREHEMSSGLRGERLTISREHMKRLKTDILESISAIDEGNYLEARYNLSKILENNEQVLEYTDIRLDDSGE